MKVNDLLIKDTPFLPHLQTRNDCQKAEYHDHQQMPAPETKEQRTYTLTDMNFPEERILSDGVVKAGNILLPKEEEKKG
ncbi:MAG: hypothetical protein K5849_04445 [Bacteroidales bacterium]|nr:hypothetical protein [Bacteroidales bacterium]